MSLQEYSKNIREKSNEYSEVLAAIKVLLKSKIGSESLKYLQTRVSNYNIEKFDFGYFPKSDELRHLYKYVNKDALMSLRLVSDWQDNNSRQTGNSDKSYFNYHNIVFPSRDEYGNIIGLIGRTIVNPVEIKHLNQPKYKYTYFSKSEHLFGLNLAKRSIEKKNYAILVEGQIDCISCHSRGYHNVVALGGSSLGDYQTFLLKKYTDTVYLLLDNDVAGEKAANKIIKTYSQDINIKKLTLPSQYNDVDEYLNKSSDYRIFERLNS